MVLAECPGGTAQVVGPVVALGLGNVADVPLGTLGELQRLHLDDAVLLGGIGDVDAFVDGQTSDFSKVMVGVGTDGAHAIGAEGKAFGVAVIGVEKDFFAEHWGLKCFNSRDEGKKL